MTYIVMNTDMEMYLLISSRWLLYSAGFMFSCVTLLVIAIYVTLYLKKRKYFYQEGIHERVGEWITETIMVDSAGELPLSKGLQHIARNPVGQQLLVDALLQCRKNFTGQTARDIVALYERLGLKGAAVRNLDSPRWDIKAHAIQELYLMDQHDILKRIYKNVNNRHELLRMEAQLGVLHLTGFEGLRFLDVISYPLSEWQQLKLLDQLGSSTVISSLGDAIPKWLRSTNDSVVQFALKLADEYQLVGLHDEIAVCLHHRHAPVRSQAISTLLRIASERTPGLLAACYEGESLSTRLTILAGLERIGTEEESAMLAGLLEDDNDRIKLYAARALAHCSGNGLGLLSEKAKETPYPFQPIYLQIKSELST
jgi:hypothetical protein